MIRHNGITINRKNRTIEHRGAIHKFVKTTDKHQGFKSIVYLLLGGGISLEMLFHHVYGDDPEGGPIAGPHYFLIRINQWQPMIFDALGLEWRSWKIAGVSFYEVVPKFQLVDPWRFSFTRRKNRAPRTLAK